jgi:hypothetical protein
MITPLTKVYVHIHIYVSLKDQNRGDHGISFTMHFHTPKMDLFAHLIEFSYTKLRSEFVRSTTLPVSAY